MKKLLLTLGITMVAFVIQAQTNYYINAATGNDDNDGTASDKAWKTINQHADTWRNADCILNIAEGEYIINAKIYLGANVQIVGASKDKVFLMGATDDDFAEDRHGNKPFTSSGFFDVSGGSKTTTIKDLTMKNMRLGDGTTVVWGGFITVQSSNKLIMNTVDILNGELPVGGGAGIDCKGELDLTNVKIANCIADRQGAAISLNEKCVVKLTGCTFENNTGASTINSYLPEVADGVCGDLKIDNCFFVNNDYSAVQYGACIFLGNFYGKKLNYHVTNSTFSGNKGNSAGVFFITTNMDKAREIDFLVSNSTFANNVMTGGNHGTVYYMNLSANSNIKGSISFVNSTFYHNDRPEGSTLGSSDIFFQDMSVDFNLINNIFLTNKGSWGTVLNYSAVAANNCKPTIKGNIFERIGGGSNGLTDIANDHSLNTKVGQEEDEENALEYINGNDAVKLSTTLTYQSNNKAPYLALEEGSVAIDGGIKDHTLVPALDIRGKAIVNDKKDVGAYEYDNGGATHVSDIADAALKAYVDPTTGTVELNKDAVSVNIYSISGGLIRVIANSSIFSISDLPGGVYILKAEEANGTVSVAKIQK